MIKIALAQLNFCVGDIVGNTNKIIDTLIKARSKKINLLIFPELSLLGYPPGDLLLRRDFIEENLMYFEKIKNKSRGIAVILGFVYCNGKNIYNAYALVDDGKVIGINYKNFLSNKPWFEENKYFVAGKGVHLHYLKGHKFSVVIGEDIEGIDRNPDLDFIINIVANPFILGRISLIKKKISYLAKRNKCLILYCNLVGGEDSLVFDGTSMVVSSLGKILGLARRFREDLLIVSLPSKNSKKYNLKEEKTSAIFDALCLGIKDYVNKNGFNKVILGVSGGIDSAVVAGLSVIALGKNNVYGVIMPSPYTSSETFSDAKKLCSNLGISFYVVPIDEIFYTYLKYLKPFFKNYPLDITEENIQARIRANILMAFSNKFGSLVLNTGNKSELACGYCTLYGDMIGGLAVLSDITKTEVYSLAKYINKLRKNWIPVSIIKRPPTAELKYGQKDTDTLPPYDILDYILKLYIDKNLSLKEMIEKGLSKELLRKVIKLVSNSEYKRRQAPLGIRITDHFLKEDIKLPVTNKFFLKNS
ncbi:MAG: NAD+ synthase [Candidatus Omnitrophica bacterium]|nr:NAD+ synthase [Candidatus Omnitrophota bacterium]